MDSKLFGELVDSLKEGGKILRGKGMSEEKCLYCGSNEGVLVHEYEGWKHPYPTDCIAHSKARIAELEAQVKEWREDAERLAHSLVSEYRGCSYCGAHEYNDQHAPDCTITLHRQLVEKETR
jgi:hypothetical protein